MIIGAVAMVYWMGQLKKFNDNNFKNLLAPRGDHLSKTSIYTSPAVVLQSTVKDAFESTILGHFSRVFVLR